MNNFHPMILNGDIAQLNEPEIRQTSGNHQVTQTPWIGEVAFVQEISATFLVREEGFDLKS